ncbi:MAG: ubiquinone biosynthesis protein UbiE [Lachnospiraceae bacterium]|nr:ubiquinone biosynthesis protein UbiE [Lachnospiraceae bacterium]
METEEFISGFCKKQNQTRMVFCEFECSADGRRTLLSTDCDYGKCEHSQTCALVSGAKAGAAS